ncbi:hypothetical protein C8F04DRAFT_1251207 [Mycena alexandri]|uniref:Uncharacterized protein n=1 Tax=Mycena alexandri TaxID=1745969 RepID=A0AAD6TBE0_9AGAR|nr:hypothetical protein C8F04DRAFT_1251207 [Mycena alexandri]
MDAAGTYNSMKNAFEFFLFELEGSNVLDTDARFASATRYAADDVPNPGWPSKTSAGNGIAASGIWKILSTKISFDNPAWNRWVEEVAGPATLCALHADGGDGEFQFVLNSLRVIRENTEVMENEVEPTGEKIAEFVVVLPSVFRGGQLQLSHDGEVKTWNLADESGLLTVGAYVGVDQTWGSIESGYCVSLCYDVLYHGAHSPSLADLDDQSGQAPQFLACLLHDQCKQLPFEPCSLRGIDEQLLGVLRPFARELGFSLHLADIEVTVKIAAGWSKGDSSVVWEEAESFGDYSFASSFTGDLDGKLEITQTYDLQGIPAVVEGLEIELKDLVNGANVTLYEPHSTTDDGCGHSVDTYKRTILIVLPANTSLNVTVRNVHEIAWDVLSTSSSTTATPKEKCLIDYYVRWCAMVPEGLDELQRVLRLIRTCSERWGDIDIFLAAMEAARRVSSVGLDDLVLE